MAGYSLGDAARILKVKPGRLRYWDRTALVHASRQAAREEGFDFSDLVCARGILGLLDQGVSLQRIRRSVEALRERMPELDDPAGSLRLWSKGSQRVVIDHDGVLIEPSGQMVLDFRAEKDGEDLVAPIEQGAAGNDESLASGLEWFEEGCRLDADPATYDQAIEAYLHGIEVDPDFADLHCNLGAVYYNRGQRDLARGCFERCLQLSPAHVESHFNLGNLLEEDGCDDLALRHYRSALESDPFCVDLHVNLALLYEKLGRRDHARVHWRRYLKLDGEGAWAAVARLRLDGG